MKGVLKIEDEILFLILEVIVFLKPVSDMFYSSTLVDVVMMLLASVFLIFGFRPIRVNKIDAIVMFLIVLFTASLVNDWGALRLYIKIVTPTMLYYAVKMTSIKEVDKLGILLKYSYELTIIVNFVILLIGKGVKDWTKAMTFCGIYYFKTDCAIALLFAIVFISCYGKRWYDYVMLLLAYIMIIITNARMAYIVLSLFVLLSIYYLRNKTKTNHIYFFILIMLSFIFGTLLVKAAGNSYIGQKMNYISTYGIAGVENKMDIVKVLESTEGKSEEETEEIIHIRKSVFDFVNANLQGRLRIWIDRLEMWYKGGLRGILIGKEYSIFGDPHSAYFSVLFYTGVIGSISFLLLIYYGVKFTFELSDIRWFYMAIGMYSIILIIGLSYATVSNTQCTWVPAIMMATLYNAESKRRQ